MENWFDTTNTAEYTVHTMDKAIKDQDIGLIKTHILNINKITFYPEQAYKTRWHYIVRKVNNPDITALFAVPPFK